MWESWISDKENHCVSLARDIDFHDDEYLEMLSKADLSILDEIYAQYGNMNEFELVEFTHNPNNIPEWQDPKGSNKKIELRVLLAHLGKSRKHIDEILQERKEQEEIDRLFRGL